MCNEFVRSKIFYENLVWNFKYIDVNVGNN